MASSKPPPPIQIPKPDTISTIMLERNTQLLSSIMQLIDIINKLIILRRSGMKFETSVTQQQQGVQKKGREAMEFIHSTLQKIQTNLLRILQFIQTSLQEEIYSNLSDIAIYHDLTALFISRIAQDIIDNEHTGNFHWKNYNQRRHLTEIEIPFSGKTARQIIDFNLWRDDASRMLKNQCETSPISRPPSKFSKLIRRSSNNMLRIAASVSDLFASYGGGGGGGGTSTALSHQLSITGSRMHLNQRGKPESFPLSPSPLRRKRPRTSSPGTPVQRTMPNIQALRQYFRDYYTNLPTISSSSSSSLPPPTPENIVNMSEQDIVRLYEQLPSGHKAHILIILNGGGGGGGGGRGGGGGGGGGRGGGGGQQHKQRQDV
jgi:hypothetical protein